MVNSLDCSKSHRNSGLKSFPYTGKPWRIPPTVPASRQAVYSSKPVAQQRGFPAQPVSLHGRQLPIWAELNSNSVKNSDKQLGRLANGRLYAPNLPP